jgi:hypothetical protein
MKIDISRKDLWYLRNLIHCGMSQVQMDPRSKIVGTKAIRKLNRAIRSVEGHDCCGSLYLPNPSDQPRLVRHFRVKTFDGTRKGNCRSYFDHFEIDWDDGGKQRALDLSYIGVEKDFPPRSTTVPRKFA